MEQEINQGQEWAATIDDRLNRLEAYTFGTKIAVANGALWMHKGVFHWRCSRCHNTGIEQERKAAEKIVKLPCASHGGPQE